MLDAQGVVSPAVMLVRRIYRFGSGKASRL